MKKRFIQTGTVDGDLAYEVAGREQAQARENRALQLRSHTAEAFKTYITFGAFAIITLVIMAAFLIALFGNLKQYLATASAFMQILLNFFIPGVFASILLFLVGKAYIGWITYKRDNFELKRMHDENTRENKKADAEIEKLQAEAAEIRARAQQLALTLPVDERGNLVYLNPLSGELVQIIGQKHEFPLLTSYHNSPRATVSEEKSKVPELPAAGAVAPSFDDLLAQVTRNSLDMCFGRSLKSGEYLIENLDKKHMLLIGGSQKGKSTLSATVMDMLTVTHDRDRLQMALLDLEDMTCNLFADRDHVLRFNVQGRVINAVARNPQEVAQHLRYLVQLMDYRYTLSPKERAALPHVLIYLEEFLELKRRLKGKAFDDMADDFTSLAIRGLKANMHLMVCAQASYSQEEFRDAMGSINGISISFCAPPRLAQAAGFLSFDLLKQNYLAKTPGQFVIESTSCTDMGIAAAYDLKGKLHAMQEEEEDRISAHLPTQRPHLVPLTSSAHLANTLPAPQGAHPDAPTWEAYTDVIERLMNEGHNQDAIIEKIWHIKKGSNPKYLAAREIYRQCLMEIKARRQDAYDRAEA